MKPLALACALSMLILSVHAVAPSRFDRVDGTRVSGVFVDVDLETKTRLYARYESFRDSGAELELAVGDKVIWREYVQPLGIAHFSYHQSVTVWIDRDDKDAFQVNVRGAKIISERRELKTGKLLFRAIRDK